MQNAALFRRYRLPPEVAVERVGFRCAADASPAATDGWARLHLVAIDNIEQMDNDINVIVPSRKQAQKDKDCVEIKPFDKERFDYDRQNDHYVCPEGHILKYKHSDKKRNRYYRSEDPRLCRHCQHFKVCTKNKYGRKVQRLANEDFQEHLEAIYTSKEGQKHGWKWGPYPKGSKNWQGIDQWEYMNLPKWIRENPTVELPRCMGLSFPDSRPPHSSRLTR